MNADDETNITDIELMPDGRIYVFGTSLEVLAVLDGLQQGRDEDVKHRLGALSTEQEVKCHTKPTQLQGNP